jgi:hypothetical protein
MFSQDLKQYFTALVMTLLTRLQTNKTESFVHHFAYFLLFTMAIDVQGLGPDDVIGTVEGIQPACVHLLLVYVFGGNLLMVLQTMVTSSHCLHHSPSFEDAKKGSESCCSWLDKNVDPEYTHDTGAKCAGMVCVNMAKPSNIWDD